MDRAESIVANFISALSQIHKEKKIDLIVFTGDMIDKAGQTFEEPHISNALLLFEEKVIKSLIQELDLPSNRFVFTMGNHEVNRDVVSPDDEKDLKENLKSKADVDNYILNKKESESRISEYNEYRNYYWNVNKGDAEVKFTPFQLGVKMVIDNLKIGINCLNTAWRCYDSKTDEHKIVLGKSQITDSQRFFDDCNIRLAIGHHHPNMMNQFEISTIHDLFTRNYDAFFCGHTHDNDGAYMSRPHGSCFYFTAPGTLSANESEQPKFRNGFMVIDYEHELRYVDAQCYYQDDNADFVKDLNYGDKGVWRQMISASSIIKPIDLSLLCQRKEGEFIKNDTIDEIIAHLRNDNIRTIHFVALTGLGKTRILHEAFDDGQSHKNHFYCEFSDNKVGLLYDIDTIITEHKGEKGLIILDNCPNEVLEMAVDKRNRYASEFRIIGVNNEYYDRNSLRIKDCIQILLVPDNTRQTVNNYIERNIPEINGSRSIQEQIKKIADGFPGMAVELVSEYQKERDINVHTVDHIVKKILKIEVGKETEYEIALRSMALFQPCPYRGDFKEAFRFIIEDEGITPFYGRSQEEKRRLFNQTINIYNGSIIEITQSWLNIRPLPLAIWLVDRWFESGIDEDVIAAIIERIEKLDAPLYSVISDGLCKRLTYMQDSVSAQEMVARLISGPNAPFCSEKVVCSELGSRLFLAMSSVNPVAVTFCLQHILLSKDVNWTKENIKDDVRRNLVWALEKLCFKKECYSDSSKIMALLAVAENESWSNNATGLMTQLFHIMLPGTQSSLQDRIATLQYLKDSGKAYETLALDCYDHAFNSGNFSRSSSGSSFGIKKEEKDYMPKTNREIIEYWEQCRDILIRWINEDISIIERVAQLVINHVLRWAFDGMMVRMFPLIEKVAISKDWDWPEMYTNICRISKKHLQVYPQSFLQSLEAFKQKLHPEMFCQQLKDAKMLIYDNYLLDVQEYAKYEQKVFRPLAKKFLDENIYLSEQELKALVTDKDYHDMWFSLALQEIITDVQLEKLLRILKIIIDSCGGEELNSSFISRICFVFRERQPLRLFLQQLYESGYRGLYIRLLANSETESLMSYYEIKNKISLGELDDDFAAAYLNCVSIISYIQIRKIISCFSIDYPAKVDELMGFIVRHRYDKDVLKDKDTYNIIKRVAIAYTIVENNSCSDYEYSQYVKSILEDYHDEEFAVAMNRKLIEVLNNEYFHRDFDELYIELIKDYREVIWADFEAAFVSDNYYRFVYQISNAIGSGSGFGAGILFQVEDERIKDMCKKYPQIASRRVAQMIPVFQDDNHFSDWFMWMLDNYGMQKDVLDGLHFNMGSFSWTGSLVPLLEKKKRCMNNICGHQHPEVRKWAESCLRELEAELKMELDREEYMRLHYD